MGALAAAASSSPESQSRPPLPTCPPGFAASWVGGWVGGEPIQKKGESDDQPVQSPEGATHRRARACSSSQIMSSAMLIRSFSDASWMRAWMARSHATCCELFGARKRKTRCAVCTSMPYCTFCWLVSV